MLVSTLAFVAVLMMMTSSYEHYLMNKLIDYWATKGFLGPWGTLLINEIMSIKPNQRGYQSKNK